MDATCEASTTNYHAPLGRIPPLQWSSPLHQSPISTNTCHVITRSSSASSSSSSTCKKPRRNNSERAKQYRKKRKERENAIITKVTALRRQVQQLSRVRALYQERAVTSPTLALRMVEEYFHVFQYGMYNQRQSGYGEKLLIGGVRQQTFLMAMAEPQLAMGELVGMELLIDQWIKYSKLHSSIRIELVSLRLGYMMTNVNYPVISASGILHVRYNRKTIESIFPHALGNEELVQRLVGREIHIPYRDDFYFNSDGKLFRYELEADYVSGLREALGNLKDVTLMLGEALFVQGALIQAPIPPIDTIVGTHNKNGAEQPPNNNKTPSFSAMALEYILS